VDLHLSYDFAGVLPGAIQAFLDVTNLFNTDPPFENNQSAANNSAAVTGYDPFSASPIGRVVTAGVRARF
jgi:outer membrane receptor protein involved in Fe transport